MEKKKDGGVAGTVDLLVVGAGMAGLSAAGYLASQGGTALVVEKGKEIGGSAAMSGGKLWTAPSLAALREEDPGADPALASVLMDDFAMVVDWIRSLGIGVSDETRILGWGTGHDVDILGYLERCRRLIEAVGGAIVRDASVEELLVSAGRVVGGRLVDRDGSADVRATHTLLATGGFQASAELRGKFIHPQAAGMQLRSQAYSTGDGLCLGTSVGAAQVPDPSGFYGHLVCAPIRELLPKDYTRLVQYYSGSCLLFNENGRRFCDESRGDHANAQALVREPRMRGLLVADHEVFLRRASVSPASGIEALDKFAEAAAAGANSACVDAMEELEDIADGWGVAGDNLVAGVREFNAWCEGTSPVGDPFRRKKIRPLDRAPFHVLEVSPAISFTYGGLRIDSGARVLDRAGAAIPGLLAAGADGCAFVHGYAGGLGMSAVFALRAARTALGLGGGP